MGDAMSAGDAKDRGVQADGQAPRAFDGFAPWVRSWFADAFGSPTPIQERAWAQVAAGNDTLVVAPTGSGKTLAAFLHAIDLLAREKADCAQAGGTWKPGVRVLYVSPMKALGADVDRNLQQPLAQIAARASREADDSIPRISTAQRTGDTTPEERRAIVRTPPDILITTPESLYLMLTSKAREVLRTVEHVIVDEIHAVMGSKRGAHLALSLERLDALLEAPAQRIGLSATVRPLELAARFLGGSRQVEVVAQREAPAFDVEVRVPVPDMAAIPPYRNLAFGGPAGNGSPDGLQGSSSIWPHLEGAILDQVLAHGSTIVFVNSRGLCEKLTARLNELFAQRSGSVPAFADASPALHRPEIGGTSGLAQDVDLHIARAHHGSVSKDKRLEVEAALKRGELRCVVATSSLELGIDMGSVDLVLQVASPPSVASGLQRVGRANHRVGGRSQALVYPRTRTEVADAAAVVEGMMAGRVERTSLVCNALDVLAQQTVAAVSQEELTADAWYAVVTRAANYADLSRTAFDAMLAMVSGGYGQGALADLTPRLVWDRETGALTPRPESQRLAVTGAGTIPDRGSFPVMLPQSDGKRGRKRVGELDEEMVMESRVGDIIALGTSTWKITEISGDRVLVDPAPGRSARLPFWHGDAPARQAESGREKGAFLRAVCAGMQERDGSDACEAPAAGGVELDAPARARLDACGLDANARKNLLSVLALQRAATGAVPTDRTLVVERCQDEMGDRNVILHSPYGRRVHEPWALAVAQRVKAEHGFDPQVLAADDGIIVRFPVTDRALPGAELFAFDPDVLEAVVRASVDQTALFSARFRECAARALLMKPLAPGKRAPLWLQRVKGGQLLEAARKEQGFPLLAEAARECLQDVYDMEALRVLLEAVSEGAVRFVEADTAVPSPFAAPLLFGYQAEHLYEGDLPHAERSAALLSIDPALLSELLGSGDVAALLDPDVVRAVESQLQRTADGWRLRGGAEGAFDLLRSLGPLSVDELACRLEPADGKACAAGGVQPCSQDAPASEEGGNLAGASPADGQAWLAQLEDAHRAFPVQLGGMLRWACVNDAPAIAAVTGAAVPSWALAQADGCGEDGPHSISALALLDGLAARHARTHGPFKVADLAERLGVGAALVEESLGRLAGAGDVTRIGTESRAWVDCAVLARLRKRSLDKARQAVAPVGTDAFVRFLLERQGLAGALAGVEGVAEVLVQHEGVALPFEQWEREVLPLRVAGYRPAMLDELIASGEVVWQAQRTPEGERVAFFPADSPLAPVSSATTFDVAETVVPVDAASDQAGPLSVEAAVMRVLSAGGALGFASIVEGVRASGLADKADERSVARALGRLAAEGVATNDTLAFWRNGGPAAVSAVDPLSFSQATAASLPPLRTRASSRRGRSGCGQMKRRAEALARDRVRQRSALTAALGGLWSLLAPPQVDPTSHAVALIESLLDRYGLVTRDIALASGVPGGLQGLYPVLRSMEQAGGLLRGAFVKGLGPLQFMERASLEKLRALAGAGEGAGGEATAVVLPVEDPACLFGAGIPWPEPAWDALRLADGDRAPDDGGSAGGPDGSGPARGAANAASLPQRKAGALVVLVGGAAVLYAAPKLKSLVAFVSDSQLVDRALSALVAFERDRSRSGGKASRRKVVVQRFNGEDVLGTAAADALAACGFVRMPEGMRLYVDPF